MQHRFMRLALAALVIAGAPAAAHAQSGNLTVHGYLSQAYATAQDEKLYGIDTLGTMDYRALALQFRYAMPNRDALVVQFSSRRQGNSLIQTIEPDVALDWAFYQKNVAGNSLRIGKVPMPRGFFNEIRDVGTIFPFYRASKAFYSEGVETIDGISVGRTIDIGSTGFSIDGSAYAGEFDVVLELATTEGLDLIQSRQGKAIGAHATINTPMPGLRFSADYLSAENKANQGSFPLWTAGVDLSKERYFVRGEYEQVNTTDSDGSDNTQYLAYYYQAGIGVTEKLWINYQYEFNSLKAYGVLPSPPMPSPDFEYDNIKDNAFGVSYKVSPGLVVKGEYHTFEGYQLDRVAPPLNPQTGARIPAPKAKYFILSLAAAF